jgi:hypothetical protein
VVVRKGVVRVTARFRKDVHRRLLSEAKSRDISVNDEIERRIESSFDFERWREERQVLLLALKGALLADPKANAMALEALDKLEIADERDFRKYDLPEILPVERKRERK